MLTKSLDIILEHIEAILGGIGAIISYFVGTFTERRKERKNQIDSLKNEIELSYQEIIDNSQKTPPNISSNRYKLPIIERKIKDLCKLKHIEASDVIKEHAKLSVYATDEQRINPQEVASQASKVIEKL